jgi:hypothetical protein
MIGQERAMTKSALIETTVFFSCVMVCAASAQETFKDTNAFASCENRFAIIFPGNPSGKDVNFTTETGASVPARQFTLERGGDRYSVTVVNLASGPELDEGIISHAADALRKQGQIRFEYPVGYIAGVRGRQLVIAQPNGKQVRGSVYMHDHRIYITEASTAVGDVQALQFDQSITIIDADGVDVDRGQTNTAQRVFTCR